jgi:hypothetical protein
MRTVLSGIAEITGGQYFHAQTGAALDSIYAVIDELEAPEEVVTQRETKRSERLGLLLLALGLVASEAVLKGSRWGLIP